MATQNAILQAIAQVNVGVENLRLEIKGDLTTLRQEFVEQVKLLPTRAEFDLFKQDHGALNEQVQRNRDQIAQINMALTAMQSLLSTNATDLTNLRSDFTGSQKAASRRTFEVTQQQLYFLVTIIIFLGGIIGAHLLWK